MVVNVLSSGSKGNCTALTDGKVTILLDAGIKFDTLQQALNFENPFAALITHEHGDHVNKATLNELLKRGVNVFMTQGTAAALELENRHNLIIIPTQGKVELIPPPIEERKVHHDKGILFYTKPTKHDAAEPVCFNLYFFGNGVIYFTDSGDFTNPIRFLTPGILIIEANHFAAQLINADIDEHQKQRILQNHLSIEKVLEWTEKAANNKYYTWLKEIHLIHISKRHGNAELFKQAVQSIVGEGVKVFAH